MSSACAPAVAGTSPRAAVTPGPDGLHNTGATAGPTGCASMPVSPAKALPPHRKKWARASAAAFDAARASPCWREACAWCACTKPCKNRLPVAIAVAWAAPTAASAAPALVAKRACSKWANGRTSAQVRAQRSSRSRPWAPCCCASSIGRRPAAASSSAAMAVKNTQKGTITMPRPAANRGCAFRPASSAWADRPASAASRQRQACRNIAPVWSTRAV